MPYHEWLINNRSLFIRALEAEKSKINELANSVSSEDQCGEWVMRSL
jgi:hypothetical protein